MLIILWALFMVFAIVGGGFLFILWAINEHIDAKKYRKGQINSSNVAETVVKSAPAWHITYKCGKWRTETEVITGVSDEGKAMLVLMRKGIGPDKIVSSEWMP